MILFLIMTQNIKNVDNWRKITIIRIHFGKIDLHLCIQVYNGAIYVNNETLHKDIEKLRKKMITFGLSKGFTYEETIKLSKKLDNLINPQMGMLKKTYT